MCNFNAYALQTTIWDCVNVCVTTGPEMGICSNLSNGIFRDMRGKYLATGRTKLMQSD